MLFDSHIHTKFSADSEMSAVDAIAKAQSLNLGVVFTEHFDSMERKSFNQSKKEKDDFVINISTKIVPSLIFYKIRDIKIKKEDFNKYSNLSTKGNHYKLGNYLIKYKFNTNEGFKSLCELSFNFIDNSNTCFLLTQNKVDRKNEQNLFPMKFTKKNGNEYIFQCIISFDEFDNEKEDEVRMEIEALVFSI